MQRPNFRHAHTHTQIHITHVHTYTHRNAHEQKRLKHFHIKKKKVSKENVWIIAKKYDNGTKYDQFELRCTSNFWFFDKVHATSQTEMIQNIMLKKVQRHMPALTPDRFKAKMLPKNVSVPRHVKANGKETERLPQLCQTKTSGSPFEM